MDSYMNKDKIIPVILAQVRDRYRFVRSRWWRLEDGYWVQDSSAIHLRREIYAIMEQMPQDTEQNRKLLRWAGMSYGIGWLVTRCRDKLTDDGLPGHPEAPRRPGPVPLA